MSDACMMKVIERVYNLLEKLTTYIFFYLSVGALLFHILMKRYSRNIVCNYAYLLTSFYQIIHFDNMRVVNFLQSHNFPLNCFSFHTIVQLRLLIYFNSKLAHVHFVITSVHCCVCSLADGFADLVVLQHTMMTSTRSSMCSL